MICDHALQKDRSIFEQVRQAGLRAVFLSPHRELGVVSQKLEELRFDTVSIVVADIRQTSAPFAATSRVSVT